MANKAIQLKDSNNDNIYPIPSNYKLGDVIGMRGWNQLVQNGNFADTNLWEPARGTLTVSNNVGTLTVNNASGSQGITRPFSLITNHKYYGSVSIRASVNTQAWASLSNTTIGENQIGTANLTANVWQSIENIITLASPVYNTGIKCDVQDTPVGTTINYKNFMAIDLTALFGAGNEPSTVEEFRTMFPADYYPYYTITEYNAFHLGTFTSSTSLAYTGKSFTIPANSRYSLRFRCVYNNASPQQIALVESPTNICPYNTIANEDNCSNAQMVGVTDDQPYTIYIWVRCTSVDTNIIDMHGWIESR